MNIDRIPSALELNATQIVLLRNIVANGFMPEGHASRQDKALLLSLALIQCMMGGLIATPAGRIVARL